VEGAGKGCPPGAVLTVASAPGCPGGCGGLTGDCATLPTFQAPFAQTQVPPEGTQCPSTQVALGDGGTSQCGATHFHCPFSEFQWPAIQTEACLDAVLSEASARAAAHATMHAAAASTVRILVFMFEK
jgi:hypothetical protein